MYPQRFAGFARGLLSRYESSRRSHPSLPPGSRRPPARQSASNRLPMSCAGSTLGSRRPGKGKWHEHQANPQEQGAGLPPLRRLAARAEGAAIHPGEKTAVIADVHLGYEWARGLAGDCVPAHSLEETLEQLESLLARAPIDRLVVAGDLVECPRRCSRTAADIARLVDWLVARDVRLVLLEGNHDRSLTWMTRDQRPDAGLAAEELRPKSHLVVAGWTIAARPSARGRNSMDHRPSSSGAASRGMRGTLFSRRARPDYTAGILAQCRRSRRLHRKDSRELAATFSAMPGQHRQGSA